VEADRKEADGVADVDRRRAREERAASEPAFSKAFPELGGVPMVTTFVAALALAGIANTHTAVANAALDRRDKGAPLGRIIVDSFRRPLAASCWFWFVL
jgi:hypothetical protein